MFQVTFSEQSLRELKQLDTMAQLGLIDPISNLKPADLANPREPLGRFHRAGREIYRLRSGDHRFYFTVTGDTLHTLYILHKNSLEDWLYRMKLPVSEQQLVEQHSKFWKYLEKSHEEVTAMDELNPKSGPDDPQNPYHVSQASRIYFLPNLMTAGNLFCGFVAVIHCIQARLAETTGGGYLGHTPAEHYRSAVWFILGAAAFDTLDGRLARMGGRESLFGAEFDSLADVISFGIAPALMMFFLILSPTQGYEAFRNIGWFLGFVYLLCAAIRLARFNVITNPLLHRDKHDSNKDFVGLPVPAAAATVAALVLFLLHLAENDKSLQRWALALPPLMGLIAVLMVSTIRYPSGKHVDMQTKTHLMPFVALMVFIAAVVLFKEIALLCATLGYIFFGIIRHLRRRHRIKAAPHSL